MGRSQESFNKKEVRKRKEKKRKEKEEKRQARSESGSNSLDDMIAYVDEYGNITDTPPDPDEKEEIKVEDIQVSTPKKYDEPEDVEKTGTVSFFNEEKGFGFIKSKGLKQDVFVHINNCHSQIAEGNLVSFKTEKGPKGLVAVDVKIEK